MTDPTPAPSAMAELKACPNIDTITHDALPDVGDVFSVKSRARAQVYIAGAIRNEVALAAADCSAIICEHATRLGLDPFASAAIARAVIGRIHKLTEAGNVR